MTQKKLREKLYKSNAEIREEARLEFIEIAQRLGMSEECMKDGLAEETKTSFAILKQTATCLQNDTIQLTDLEIDIETQNDKLEIEQTLWANPDQIKLNTGVKYFIKNHCLEYSEFKKDVIFQEQSNNSIGLAVQKMV